MDDLVFLGQEETPLLQNDAQILLTSSSFNGSRAFRFPPNILGFRLSFVVALINRPYPFSFIQVSYISYKMYKLVTSSQQIPYRRLQSAEEREISRRFNRSPRKTNLKYFICIFFFTFDRIAK